MMKLSSLKRQLLTSASLSFSIAAAHMRMVEPVPYTLPNLTEYLSPLLRGGSNFPCKAVDYQAGPMPNTMQLGSMQNLMFIGKESHGGGSCQISITYDFPPQITRASGRSSSPSKVAAQSAAAKTVGNTANGDPWPDVYVFKIPTNIATGNATLVSGDNPGPVLHQKRFENGKITSNSQLDAFAALPDMFIANIGKSCRTPYGVDVLFPKSGKRAGPSSTTLLTSTTPASSSSIDMNSSSSIDMNSSSSSSTTSYSVVPIYPTTSATGSPFIIIPTDTLIPSTSTSTPITWPSSSSTSTAAVPDKPPNTETTGTKTTMAGPGATAAGTTAGTGTGAGTNSLLTGPCTSEGLFRCLSRGTTYQRCASGIWSAAQQVAPGTMCTPTGNDNGDADLKIVVAAGSI
ncbi:hypothetical protein B0H66DRAFT_604099 [Apodospora peruviana]|uniref:Uncharacterized protein n=1 Tax=Apodospora peruviana TaxID=516989 RepID=A0AAE0M1L5_9PEZI|nr:hypothetical protein B0H66DRAFT_604099 [Apodospora peruviana]